MIFCHLNYAPVTSVDVERWFSIHKIILSDDKRSAVFAHIKQYNKIVQCNAQYLIGKIVQRRNQHSLKFIFWFVSNE